MWLRWPLSMSSHLIPPPGGLFSGIWNVSQRTDSRGGGEGAGGVLCRVLHEFLTSNRTVLIDRCRDMVGSRSDPKATEDELVHGIPTFLDQLIETLTLAQTAEPHD